MRILTNSFFARTGLTALLAYNVGACVLIFGLLEAWRRSYFLTDDNLSGVYPVLVEMGRHIKNGEPPYVSQYLFGGHYDWTRDIGCLYWHPFFLLPALLADTWAQNWIVDVAALFYLLLTTIGFTLLAHKLREEYELTLTNGWLAFYTLSFVFSMYILFVGPSWSFFLGNQSALPWLTLGMLERRITRGILLVTLFTIHQFVGSYAGMTISNTLLLTLFSIGLTISRRSARPLFIWSMGTLLGYLLIAPFVVHVLEGFSHAVRAGGYYADASSLYSVPAEIFPFSFFLGNWTEPITVLRGDPSLASYQFPFLSGLLPCLAAWCIVPALLGSSRWRAVEALCLGMAAVTMLFIIRPEALAVAIQHIPIIRGLRWPFREILQFSFFIHLFLILRPPLPNLAARRLVVTYSAAAFLLPLPFIRVPTLNPLKLDREIVFSGAGDRFWDHIKPLLDPTDEIATIIDPKDWSAATPAIPYAYLGTANFPALYQVTCVSGYSTTCPRDQLPIQTQPNYWFGAYAPEQVGEILSQRPRLKLIVLESISPLKISLRAQGHPAIDLTPYLSPTDPATHP